MRFYSSWPALLWGWRGENLHVWGNYVIFAARIIKILRMEITFAEDYLRELYYDGKTHSKKYRFQPQIVKKYIRVIDLMESLSKTEDLYRYKALHYEALTGDKKGRESVRVNDQYRIEFHSEVIDDERTITICNILELSNHYK